MMKKLLSLLLVALLVFGAAISVFAKEGDPAPGTPVLTIGTETFLYDEADLLTESEETALAANLQQVSQTYNAQLVVVIMSTLGDKDIDSYVDELYDSLGLGYGADHDGVLLLVSMDPREFQILSNGYAGVAMGPDQVDAMSSLVGNFLSDEAYVAAVNCFASQCEEYLDGYINGYPFDVVGTLITSLVVGGIVGAIVAFVLKGQLKSVHKQYQANSYVKQDSMQVEVSHDLFLYRNVTCTRRERESSSSSASSGGTARSKGGGSF